jgi:hypothetical protein
MSLPALGGVDQRGSVEVAVVMQDEIAYGSHVAPRFRHEPF